MPRKSIIFSSQARLAWHNTRMKPRLPLFQKLTASLDEFRLQTARPDALIQLSLLGLLTGLLAGLVIVAFIFTLDTALRLWLPAHAENFEGLAASTRLMAPLLGAAILGLLFRLFAKPTTTLGVVNVLERLRYHEGYMKTRDFFLQFLGGSIALISGQSMGREGPGIHLGAFVGSYIGQQMRLPNNTVRTLVACGAAASIAAAFNTPLAGVIFAMEIIIVEYTMVSFIPIIISAVAATAVSRSLLVNESALSIPSLTAISLTEIPFLLLLGVLLGFASTLFTIIIRKTTQLTQSLNVTVCFMIAGALTGGIALAVPQVMGLGYDTLNQAVLGQLPMTLLLVILICKLVATAVSIGCGLPAGLITPSLVMGASAGSLMGVFLQDTLALPIQSISMYALIGMGAMMGACLQAPLAALTAVFEITANYAVVWPSMLSIVIAQLISRQLFKQPPVFDLLLQARGLGFNDDPVIQPLQRIGVAKIMNRNIVFLDKCSSIASAEKALASNPQWVCVEEQNQPLALLRSVDLIHYLQKENLPSAINLMEIPARRYDIACIDVRATMAKAWHIFKNENAQALCVTHWNKNASRYIYGVLTRDQFEHLYMKKR